MSIGGFFQGLGRAVTRPVRGLGRMLRGDFGEGLADLGYGAKYAGAVAGLATGNPALALGLGAGGGAAEAIGEGRSFGNVLRNTAQGAAIGGAGLGARALGGRLLQGGGAANAAAGGATPASQAAEVSRVYPGLPSVSQTGGGAVQSFGSRLANTVGDVAGRVGGAAKGIGSYVAEHPTLVGSGLEAMGEYQQGKALDRQAELEEEALRRRWDFADTMSPIYADIMERLMQRRAA